MTEAVRAVARSTAALSGARFLVMAVRLIYVIVLTRTLGPELHAKIAYGQSWYMFFAPLAALGLGVALTTRISEAPEEAQRIIAETGAIRLIGGVLAFACAIAGAFLVEPDPGLRLVICLFAGAMLGWICSLHWQQIFLALGRAHLTLRQEALFRPVEAVLGSVIVLSGGGVEAVAVLHTAIWTLQAWHGWRRARALSPLGLAWPDQRVGRAFLRFMPVGISTFTVSAMALAPVVLGRGLLPDLAALGQLALLMQFTMMLMVAPNMLALAAQGALRRSAISGAAHEAQYALALCRALPVAAGVMTIGAGVAVSPLIASIFGQGFAPAAAHVWAIPLLWLPAALAATCKSVLVSQSRVWRVPLSSGFGAAAMLAMLLVLVPEDGLGLGLDGLLISILIGNSVWFAGIALCLREALGRSIVSWRAFGLCGLAAAAFLALDAALAPGLAALGAGAALALLVLFGAWRLILTSEERTLAVSALRRQVSLRRAAPPASDSDEAPTEARDAAPSAAPTKEDRPGP